MSRIEVAVLITCFNRVAITRRCLTALAALGVSANHQVQFSYFVVDDGSSDGTSSMITQEFGHVTLIQGDGNLYWAGGMSLAYRSAVMSGRGFGAYLLVNDDVDINVDAASRMIAAWVEHLGQSHILVGATINTAGEVTYSGFLAGSRFRLLDFSRVDPGDELVACDTFNANFVLVPGPFFDTVGGLDSRYAHGLADLDLGLVASRMGVKSFVFPEPVGICEKGPSRTDLVLRRHRAARARLLFTHPYGLRPDLVFALKHRPRWLLPAYFLHGLAKRCAMLLPPRREGLGPNPP